MARAAAARTAGFLALWVVLAGAAPRDLAVGLAAAIAAAWASVRLLSPARGRLRPSLGAAARIAPHFVAQSIAAGVDAARRALDPRLPLRPGMVSCAVRLPPATLARDCFRTLSSLLPGTLPVGETRESFAMHCLDVAQPVAAQLADEERRFVPASRARPLDE
jgi:multicomponent Na+:H+ antiporter subunit E